MRVIDTLGLVIFFLAFAQTSMALAETKVLNTSQIQDLLTGNTAVGDWNGRPYRQHFSSAGRTTYEEKGAPQSYGQWKAEADQYMSWWEGSGWSAYQIGQTDEGAYVWISSDKSERSFVIESGFKMIWPKE